MIFSFFKKDPTIDQAHKLYGQIVQQSRLQVFFEAWRTPDTVEGRFEILTLNMHLALRRLKREDKKLSQAVFDVFFKNMDDALREMGVGDMTIGKKIRGLAEAFYGRIGVYESAVDDNDRSALADAISRNIFETDHHLHADAIAGYVLASDNALTGQTMAEIIDRGFDFHVPATEVLEPAS